MAVKDTVTKEYMQDNEIFADAFNFLIYNGKQVINPASLKPLDTTSVVLPYGEDETPVPIQKYRDILKMVTAMEDDNAAYLLLGIENQSEIHYAMPVRNMLYDSMQYISQVEEASKSHRKANAIPDTRAEFLSGFHKTDKLLPVITLTIYFGADKWTAPKSLHEMLDVRDDNIMKFVSDYQLNIIAPAEISDEDFGKFHTELNQALKFVKYSKDKDKLRKVVNEDEAYKRVSRKTVNMLNVVTSSKFKYTDGEERINMCEAIEGIRNDGIELGFKKGKTEGAEEGMLKTLSALVKDEILTLSDAAKRANMSVEEFEAKTGLKA